MSLNGKHIVVVGMGPAGLMAGTRLLELGYSVSFYDHKKAAGRKFLVAGNGGFNLTHSEDFERFKTRYSDLNIEAALNLFTRDNWVDFLNNSIKIPTFTGSSGKIFPIKEIKPITVLYNWLNYIQHLGGQLYYEHELIDFKNNHVTFKTNTEENIKVNSDYIIFALGGGSWSVTGSTGKWLSLFTNKRITTNPFESFNSGYELNDWEKNKSLAGGIVKNIIVKLGDFQKEGDIVFTDYGIEGTPIYWSNQAFKNSSSKQLSLDLKPTLSLTEIETILTKAKNISEGLKKLKLSKTIINYFKINLSKKEYTTVNFVAQLIKSLTFTIKDIRPIDDVISTKGGVKTINENLSLLNYPNIFCCGEMLNWSAPTGGYLIQGAVSTGYYVASEIEKLNQRL